MTPPRLVIKDLYKAFAAPVLKGINLTLEAGEIRAVVGENGAGKSTLMNIIGGHLNMDGGALLLDGEPFCPANPNIAHDAGISIAAQELSIIETLNVAENINLRALPNRFSVVTKDVVRDNAEILLEMVGLEYIDPQTIAGQLTLGESQLIEIAKALMARQRDNCRLLILDEPTAALTQQQTDLLHAIIKDIASEGTTVIYISHRLEDVRDIADNISVMRDGIVVETASSEQMTAQKMIKLMSGEEISQHAAVQTTDTKSAEPVLTIRNLTSNAFKEAINLDCRAGEIIGLSGLAGAGRTALLETIFGLSPTKSGAVERHSNGKGEKIKNARHAVKLGMGYLTKDRKESGVFAEQTLLLNMTLPGISSLSSSLGTINHREEMNVGDHFIKKLEIKCTGSEQSIDSLSGGNQQKTLLARWLHCNSDILLLDEPTRGVDVKSKNLIYNLLRDARDQGKTILVASSDNSELMNLCDRILVLSKHKLVKEFKKGNWTEQEILSAAFQEHTIARSGEL